jgi:hypothetical protein
MLGDRPEAQAGADNLKHRRGAPYAARRVMSRRFPPPWSIEERTESFIVKDANGQQLAYLYFEDEPQRPTTVENLTPCQYRT